MIMPHLSATFGKISFVICALAALLYVYLLPGDVVLRSVIVFGQAHFLIAYIYRNKVGRIDKPYIFKFLALTISLGLACAYIYFHLAWFPLLIFVTLTAFVLHYFLDEIKISGLETQNRLFGALAAFFAFCSILLRLIFSVHGTILYLCCVLAAFFSVLFTYYLFSEKKDRQTQIQVFIFFILNIIVPTYLAFYGGVDIFKISGFIILFHYLRWYLRYAERFYKTPEFDLYFDFVIWIHIFIILTFFQYVLSPDVGILYGFFSPLYFYAWTLIHIILSVRKNDYVLSV